MAALQSGTALASLRRGDLARRDLDPADDHLGIFQEIEDRAPLLDGPVDAGAPSWKRLTFLPEIFDK